MSYHKFDDPYWDKYTGEKRMIQCDWCKKHFSLTEILFVPCGLSRYYPMCQNCHDNSRVIELSWKYPTDEQLGILKRTRKSDVKELTVNEYLEKVASRLEPKTHCCECTPGDHYERHTVHIQYPGCKCDPKKYVLRRND